jgi:hypothetical protein
LLIVAVVAVVVVVVVVVVVSIRVWCAFAISKRLRPSPYVRTESSLQALPGFPGFPGLPGTRVDPNH